MLQFGWFPPVFIYPSPPVLLPILWWLYRAHQLQLVTPPLSCSIVFFQFSCRFLVLICLFAFFQCYLVVSRNGKVHYSAGSLFLLSITRSGHLAKIRCFVCISKYQRSVWVSFSWTDSWLYINYLYLWSNLNSLLNSQSITFPTQSCLVLYSFCTNLVQSLFMWLISLSPWPHNLHLHLASWLFLIWKSCPYRVVLCCDQKIHYF